MGQPRRNKGVNTRSPRKTGHRLRIRRKEKDDPKQEREGGRKTGVDPEGSKRRGNFDWRAAKRG